MTQALPLGLYVHYPWCVSKCPYCDFNSHSGTRQDQAYAAALITQLEAALGAHSGREISTIFFGGGTPSLMPAALVRQVIDAARASNTVAIDEITLEANPGAVDEAQFDAFAQAGVNRFSIGVQSFATDKLKALGRIHSQADALRAIEHVQSLELRLNIDLMYGLPQQDLAQARADLQRAIDTGVAHLSWYQLTLEENTPFYHRPPKLPIGDALDDIADMGRELLAAAGFSRYEVSAYGREGDRCLHNLNYWNFGDYIGVGAGAHGKQSDEKGIWRSRSRAQPAAYIREIDAGQMHAERLPVQSAEIAFEFMLNVLRLSEGVDVGVFTQRTGLDIESIAVPMQKGRALGLLINDPTRIQASERGSDLLFETLGLFS